MNTHCGYPGHATKLECDSSRVKVRMPTGRTYACCPSALEYALRRGGVIVED